LNEQELTGLLSDLIEKKLALPDAFERIRESVFRVTDLGYANLDHHRELRHGLCEVIYGEGKTLDQLMTIMANLSGSNRCVLATRLTEEKIVSLKKHFSSHRANEAAGTFTTYPPEIVRPKNGQKFVAIISAGTSDLKVAEEAVEVCIAMRVPFEKIYDIGIAGLHRLLNKLKNIQSASTIIVVAGMEGALPSVVGGLVGCPVIAVPTSVGYGASFQGLSSLLGMLNSCAPGITVTNIDAGFSAGFAAARIYNEMRKNENTLS